MTTTENPTFSDTDFQTFLESILGEDNSNSSPDGDADWLDNLLAGCADSINDGPLGVDHIATPERDKTGGRNHKIHVHHRETGKHIGSFGLTI